MNLLQPLFAALVGLLFDDGTLAFGIVVVLAVTGVTARTGALHAWGAIVLLVGGTVALLLTNVVRAASRFVPRK